MGTGGRDGEDGSCTGCPTHCALSHGAVRGVPARWRCPYPRGVRPWRASCCRHGTYPPASGASWAGADASGVPGRARPLPNRLGRRVAGRSGRRVPAAVLRTPGAGGATRRLPGALPTDPPDSLGEPRRWRGLVAWLLCNRWGRQLLRPRRRLSQRRLPAAARRRTSFDAQATGPPRGPRPGLGAPAPRPPSLAAWLAGRAPRWPRSQYGEGDAGAAWPCPSTGVMPEHRVLAKKGLRASGFWGHEAWVNIPTWCAGRCPTSARGPRSWSSRLGTPTPLPAPAFHPGAVHAPSAAAAPPPLLPVNYRPRQVWPRVTLHYAIAIGAAPPSRPTLAG